MKIPALAQKVVGEEHQQRHKEHPTWFSYGYSVSCAFGSDHICVCTATFYEK